MTGNREWYIYCWRVLKKIAPGVDLYMWGKYDHKYSQSAGRQGDLSFSLAAHISDYTCKMLPGNWNQPEHLSL